MHSETRVNVVGGFTIDAIIRADGTWTTGQLGGNALWASAGMRLRTGAHPVAHSVIGVDYPASALDAVRAQGIDIHGVRRGGGRTARITFAYRPDGTRSQPAPADAVGRLPLHVQPEFADTTREPAITLASLPEGADLLSAAAEGGAWHLGLLPPARFAELTSALRGAGVGYLQADCPARSELLRDGDVVLRSHLSELDAFLPSTSDTDVFAPGVPHAELVARFHEYGAPIVVMKRGEEGALVSDATTGERWSVPAYPVGEHLDATGAGDVFCGVFAAARAAGATVIDAAVEASVYGSYALNAPSPLALIAQPLDDIDERIHHIRNGVTPL
ncbi:carbohydrate kinase family protein [Microbacterium keratanolyticum]|uniref:carbohydrate kinase family protein n=1 Tax=Microbacterium keratanolyticum TaxID=67574 RepID=UPI003625526A